MPSPRTADNTLSLLDDFLKPVRSQAQKEAAVEGDKFEAKATQGEAGREQTDEAKKNKSNVDSVAPNSEADSAKPWDNQGTKKMDSDTPVVGNGNIGTVKRVDEGKDDGLDAKIARTERLGNGVLMQLYPELAALHARPTQKQAAAAPQSPQDAFIESLYLRSKEAAEQYLEGHMLGQLKRVEDEYNLKQASAGIDPARLAAAGGISGLLDKVALETPEAVLPEGLAADAGASHAEPDADDAGGPSDGDADNGGAGGDPTAELAQALEAEGVKPEELEAALQDLEKLQEAGVGPEELAQVLSEVQEQGGEKTASDAAARKIAIAKFLTR